MRGLGRLLIASGRKARRLGFRCAARAQVEFSAPDGVAKTPFERSFAQKRGRVVPERLRKGIAKIGARDADIGEHASVEPGQDIGLAAVPSRPRQLLQPGGDQRHQGGERPHEHAAGDWENRVWGTHSHLQFSPWLRRQNRYWRCPEPPEIPTRFLWKPKYIALRGLISETNVFNLIDQKR